MEATAAGACPSIVLVGDRDVVLPLIETESLRLAPAKRDAALAKISVHHAPEVIGMNESPALALRRKPRSSVAGCVDLVRSGQADSIVSAGNTGAIVGATTLTLPFASVHRPGIAVTLPSKGKGTTVIDVGANVHCKPPHLLDYGIMATAFCSAVHDIAEPTIGLLNIGEEDEKGNELVRQTMELFRRSDLNFVGNIEGQDIFNGRCDIVVCEGFVGNVILKVSEGLAETTLAWLQDSVLKSAPGDSERAVWEVALRRFKDHTDYSNYGGAMLLGVDTTCVICHGRSGPPAIANAIRSAQRFVDRKVKEHVRARLETYRDHRPHNHRGEMLGRS